MDRTEEIERLVGEYGLTNKDYARKWMSQEGGISMEEKAKDIAELEKRLAYATSKGISERPTTIVSSLGQARSSTWMGS